MFTVRIHNKKTNEILVEHVKDEKDVDFLVDAVDSIYGNSVWVDINQEYAEQKTKPYSEPPVYELDFSDLEVV